MANTCQNKPIEPIVFRTLSLF